MTTRHATDGGLETDLIFLRGFDLPEFASFPLLDTDEGRAALRDYYRAYVDIAVRAGAPILLETPTWRANPDHAALLGYDASALDRVNRESVAFLAALAEERDDELTGWEVGGMLGPRGDGYVSAGAVDPDEAADYHRPQLASFAAAGAWRDRIGGLRVNASTMSHAELDEAETLDDGDPAQLAADQAPLLDAFAHLEVLGGCCGTDARHVAAMWGVG